MGFTVGGGGLSTQILAESGDTPLTMDGSEQILYDDVPGQMEVGGWIDLNNMETDDTIQLRTYIDGVINAGSQYTDALYQSMIVVSPLILSDENWKVTLKQTSTGANGYKDVDYRIIGRG